MHYSHLVLENTSIGGERSQHTPMPIAYTYYVYKAHKYRNITLGGYLESCGNIYGITYGLKYIIAKGNLGH